MARGVAGILLLLSSPCLLAQTVADPTRPPNVLQAPDAPAQPSGPTLQAIRTVDGVRSAVISGQEVKVGNRVAEQRVLRIDEDQVVLGGAGGKQILKLFPNVSKTTSDTEPNTTKRRGDNAKRKEAR